MSLCTRLTAAGLLLALAAPAAAQTTYSWTSAAGEVGVAPRWLNPVNWTGGAAGTCPGVTAAGLPTDGGATDIARVDRFFDGVSNGLGIDFGVAGGRLTVGALNFVTGGVFQGGLAIGNSSTTTAGVLRLNGATVAGVQNVVYADTGTGDNAFSLANLPNGGSGPGMTVQLGGAESVFLNGPSALTQLFVNVPVTEAAAGSAVTVRGAQVNFLATNSYSGRTRLTGGYLNIRADSGLGTAPAAATPGMIVLEPDAAGTRSVLSTNAATFTLNANRGLAIGPATGNGDAELNVADVEVPGFQSTVTYNGAIANNGSGTGRLVKTGNGALVLGGASTYTGGTLHQGGVLLLNNLTALGTGGTVTLTPVGQDTVGYLRPASLLVNVPGTFARPVAVSYTGTRTATVGTADFAAAAETVFSGDLALTSPTVLQGGNTVGTRFSGSISGAGAVTVTGTAGMRVVAFDNPAGSTYTGGTTVASGTLLLLGQTGTASGTGSGPVSVAGGTLGGTGRAAGAVTVASNSRLTAGTDATARTLTLGSTLDITGGRYRVVLFGGAAEQASRVDAAGAVSLSNSPTLELDLNGQTVAGLRAGGAKTYTILTGPSIVGSFVPPDFTGLGFAAGEWTLATTAAPAVQLVFVPVPEPGLMLVVAAGGLLARRRRI